MSSDTPAYTEVPIAMNELRHFTYAASASNTLCSIIVLIGMSQLWKHKHALIHNKTV